ncbi:MAG: SRPBCC family protein [Planctomycetota bacterium]
MAVVRLVTAISAPVERVFDLSRSVDLHLCSMATSGEYIVAGVATGLMGLGEEVTWRARHFGCWQQLRVRITAYERPIYFADSMVSGAFRRMEHQHHFEAIAGGTALRDEFHFESPFGVLGQAVNLLVLTRYMRRLLLARNRVIKFTAEGECWRQFLPKIR